MDRIDFNWKKYADFQIGLRWRLKGSSNAIPLSDVHFILTGGDEPFVANVESGHVTLGDEDNNHRAILKIPAAEIAALADGVYTHDIVLYRFPDGLKRPAAEGSVAVGS